MTVINKGLRRAVNEHLADVLDRDGSAELVFRSGQTEPVPDGTWIVNCTGLMLRGSHPYEPFVSPSGQTLSIQHRSTAIPLTIQAGYFLTHLMFTGGLHTLPLYELDAEDMRDKLGKSPVPAVFPLTGYNLSLAFDNLPKKGVRRFRRRPPALVSAAPAAGRHDAFPAQPPPRTRTPPQDSRHDPPTIRRAVRTAGPFGQPGLTPRHHHHGGMQWPPCKPHHCPFSLNVGHSESTQHTAIDTNDRQQRAIVKTCGSGLFGLVTHDEVRRSLRFDRVPVGLALRTVCKESRPRMGGVAATTPTPAASDRNQGHLQRLM
jgi:hypothetical protein